MTEFTKGKWTADVMGEYVFAHGFDMMICQMRGWAYLKAQGLSDNEAIEVQKANARLIAAAPEMYDELYDAFQFMKAKSCCEGDVFAQQAKSILELMQRIIEGSDSNNLNSL